jgi:hypothetical protein
MKQFEEKVVTLSNHKPQKYTQHWKRTRISAGKN